MYMYTCTRVCMYMHTIILCMQCCLFNDAAKDTPMDEWPHHSFSFPIEQGEIVEVAGGMYT